MPIIIAVIPAFNEEISIGSVILKTMQYVDRVIVVDDGSSDDTATISKLAGATLLSHHTNTGKGGAIHTAFNWAIDNDVDILVILDGDGQHNPCEIPVLIAPLLSNEADMVNGSRFMEGQHEVPKYRRIGQEILTYITNQGASKKINDSQSGFRAFSSKTFGSFLFTTNGMGVESEMVQNATNAGFRIIEVPISCRYDVQGSTFNPVKHGLTVMNFLLNEFEKKHPLFYFGMPGLISIIIGFFFGIWTIYGYTSVDQFWVGKALLTMTLILVGSLGLFAGLILNSISLHFKKNNGFL